MGKNRFDRVQDEPKADDQPKQGDPQKLTSLTYMPLPEDRDEVVVGGRVFKAYEPVELSAAEATRVAHLANNSWFSTGEIDADRKQKWEQLREARRDIADREHNHAKAQADTAAVEHKTNVRPVEPGAAPFDPERPMWAGQTNREATSHGIEADRVQREAERSAREKEGVITPTPGRVVWYWPAYNPSQPALQGRQPHAAIVAYVSHDRLVNLSVLNADGQWFAARDVQLLQGDDLAPRNAYCEWMPYQKGQARKAEQREAVPPPPNDPPVRSPTFSPAFGEAPTNT